MNEQQEIARLNRIINLMSKMLGERDTAIATLQVHIMTLENQISELKAENINLNTLVNVNEYDNGQYNGGCST